MGRAPCCDETMGLKKGPWTADEDRKLLAYIEKHGHGSWRSLPREAGNFFQILHLNVENVTRITLIFFQGETIFVRFTKMWCSLNLDWFTSLECTLYIVRVLTGPSVQTLVFRSDGLDCGCFCGVFLPS